MAEYIDMIVALVSGAAGSYAFLSKMKKDKANTDHDTYTARSNTIVQHIEKLQAMADRVEELQREVIETKQANIMLQQKLDECTSTKPGK